MKSNDNFKKLITIITIIFGLSYYLVGYSKDHQNLEPTKSIIEGEVISSGLDGYNRHNIALRYKKQEPNICVVSYSKFVMTKITFPNLYLCTNF